MRSKIEDRLLAAAIALFANHGYGQTTVKAIAAVAGTNLAFAYRVFGSKKNLFEEALRHAILNLIGPGSSMLADVQKPRGWRFERRIQDSAVLVTDALIAEEWRRVALEAFAAVLPPQDLPPLEKRTLPDAGPDTRLRIIEFTGFRRH